MRPADPEAAGWKDPYPDLPPARITGDGDRSYWKRQRTRARRLQRRLKRVGVRASGQG